MFRYVALLWDPANIAASYAASDVCRRLRDLGGQWQPALRTEGLRVLAAGSRAGSNEVRTLRNGLGVVLGTLLASRAEGDDEATARATVLSNEQSDAIIASHGDVLVRSYWGRYVAFGRTRDSHGAWVLRDPSGGLPCYVATFSGLVVVFSCIADLLEIGLHEFSVNWRSLVLRIAYGTTPGEETALREVSELGAGYRLDMYGERSVRSKVWDLAPLAASARIDDVAAAKRELRSAVTHAVHSWASCYDGIIHRLSGGLDSSIVVGNLKSAPTRPRIVCLTYGESRQGREERSYPRIAAQDARCGHIEREYEHAFDFRQLLDVTPSVNPQPHLTFLQTSATERAIAREVGASSVFDGHGGDLLFGSVTRDYAACDYAAIHGLDRRLFSIAHDVALIANRSIWSVLGSALRGQGAFPAISGLKAVLAYRKFVSAELRQRATESVGEIADPSRQSHHIPAGTATLVSLLSRGGTFEDPLVSPTDLSAPDLVSPLLSQPVMETAVRIPTYVQFLGGRDRGLARVAFMGHVPQAILDREWKDYPAGASQKVLQKNLGAARELLLEGLLVEKGLLDRNNLELALSGKPSRSDGFVTEIYNHVLVEAWLRQWIKPRRPAIEPAAHVEPS